MFYFKFTATTPYCGTDHEEYHQFDEKPRIDDLEEMADEIARANAEQYEYLVTGWNNDNYDDEEEKEQALEFYYEDCSCTWEEISAEEYEENS